MELERFIPWRNRNKMAKQRQQADDHPLSSLQHAMNDLFDNFWQDFGAFPNWPTQIPGGAFRPKIDMTEDDEQYKLCAELPGMSEEDVEVHLHNGALTIKGEKSEERKEEVKGRFVSERTYGSFRRSFSLPADVLEDKIDASFKDGVLTLQLPKTSEPRPGTRKISISNK